MRALHHKETLPNGLTIVIEPHTHVRSVSVGVWVKTGSLYENESQEGISHFIEHMVFKGTEKRSPLEIATVLECLGGDLNAFTDREVTCYHATVLKEHIEIALDVLSDIVLHPQFPKEELERERKVLLQELSMVEETPEEWVSDLFLDTVWSGARLGRPIIGHRKSLIKMDRMQLLRYFRKHYVPRNMVVSIAGNVDTKQIVKACERLFQTSEEAEAGVDKTKPEKPPVFHAKRKSVKGNCEQFHLLLGYDGISVRDPRRFEALILSFFLGGGMSSRLFQEIREKEGLAYSVDCDCIFFSQTGLLTIYVAMAQRSLSKCTEILSREITRLKTEQLLDKDLNIVKGQLKGTILLSHDQMETRQESLGRNEIVFGRYVSVEEVISEIEKVSSSGIQSLARTLFQAEKEALVTLSPFKPKIERLRIA